jgi:pyruvate, water dikinase
MSIWQKFHFLKKRQKLPFIQLFDHFQKLIRRNNQALEIMADMGEKLSGEFIFDQNYINTSVIDIADDVYRMIYHLDCMAPKQFHDLFSVYNRIRSELENELQGNMVIPEGEYVIPYSAIDDTLESLVGGKNSHLGVVSNTLGLKIPEGFAITSRCFDDLVRRGGKSAERDEILQCWEEGECTTEDASRRLQDLIASLELPRSLRREIEQAVSKTVAIFPTSPEVFFAVRSSAIGEDSEHSYAGQYESLLNIRPRDVPDAYKKVLVGLYSPRAMEYRRTRNIKESEAIMAVGCQAMISAQVSGVAYTLDVFHLEQDNLLISSLYGLGADLVSGEQQADTFWVGRRSPHEIRSMEIVHKQDILEPDIAESGLLTNPLDPKLQDSPSLKIEQLQEIAEVGLQLERYFKHPQDIEFAYDREGKLVILQTRPLNIQQSKPKMVCDLSSLKDEYSVLMDGAGQIVQEGVAMGNVHLVTSDEDLGDVPNQSILVAHFSSPNLAQVIRRVSGIITDIGSPIGHLSTIAREFRVPMIINTHTATKTLKHGSEITLDANENKVYGGFKTELCYYEFTEDVFGESYEYRLLRRLLKKITPLLLLDPSARNFTPASCRTLHDVIRFVHEKSVNILIQQDYHRDSSLTDFARRLELEIPLHLTVIDFAMSHLERKHSMSLDDIHSAPLKSFSDGMCIPGLWARDPVNVDLKSFMSSMTRTFTTNVADPRFVGQNLAVTSGDYMNVSLRLGYHYSMIDSICSEVDYNNYIYFRFFGGVTDTERRTRRARLIQQILNLHGFMVSSKGDLVVGRIKGWGRERLLEKIFVLGALVSFTRQLDVKMINETAIDEFVEQFQSVIKESDVLSGEMP